MKYVIGSYVNIKASPDRIGWQVLEGSMPMQRTLLLPTSSNKSSAISVFAGRHCFKHIKLFFFKDHILDVLDRSTTWKSILFHEKLTLSILQTREEGQRGGEMRRW